MRTCLIVTCAAATLCGTASTEAQLSLRQLPLLPGTNTSSIRSVSPNGAFVIGVCDSIPVRWDLVENSVEPLDIGFEAILTGGVSNDGRTFGGTTLPVLNGPRERAYRYSETDGLTIVAPLSGGLRSRTGGLSADGNVWVGYRDNFSSRPRPFRWTPATGAVELPLPMHPHNGVSAGAVSPDGQWIVGTINSALVNTSSVAIVWHGTEMHLLGSLGDSVFDTRPDDISNNGVVVGGSRSIASSPELQAFRWTLESGLVSLGQLPGGSANSRAWAVSEDGELIVGHARDAFNRDQAFLWDEASGMRTVGSILAEGGIDLSGWVLGLGESVHRSGETITIFGDGSFTAPGSGQRSRAWVVTIPGPGVGAVVSFGLLWQAPRRRRR